MITVGACRRYMLKRPNAVPIELVPQIVMPYVFLYQADLAFYTKVTTFVSSILCSLVCSLNVSQRRQGRSVNKRKVTNDACACK